MRGKNSQGAIITGRDPRVSSSGMKVTLAAVVPPLLLAVAAALGECAHGADPVLEPSAAVAKRGEKVECELAGDSVICNGTRYSQVEEDDFPAPRFWVDLSVSASLVCVAGLMSGLTMGLMSIDFLNLQILANGGGTPQEQTYGKPTSTADLTHMCRGHGEF